ncbi:MAG: lysophospholipid acyltransferase family protein [Xanthobacteraceae bacterium]|nr:lysophospholipid acyltransferase family protein [Xanthobacteraceae bacterium]
MSWRRTFFGQPWVMKTIGVLGAEYLRLIWKTSRFTIEPDGIYERMEAELPVILAMWHGQHFMAPFVRRPHHRAKVLISKHRDGEVNAIAARQLGIETVRGSGNHDSRFDLKGGVGAFWAMLASLNEGWSMALTADVPKVSRVAGLGIIKLARESGRPIVPVAVATSRRVDFDSWDRASLNLPFSRGAMVAGEPIRVAKDADAAALEEARQALERSLNAITERAYAIVDRKT